MRRRRPRSTSRTSRRSGMADDQKFEKLTREQLNELAGEELPYLVSRPDGKVVQLPAVLYAVAEQIDGSSDYERIAARVTEAVGAELEPGDARFLVEEKLAPLGLIAGAQAQVAAQEHAEE